MEPRSTPTANKASAQSQLRHLFRLFPNLMLAAWFATVLLLLAFSSLPNGSALAPETGRHHMPVREPGKAAWIGPVASVPVGSLDKGDGVGCGRGRGRANGNGVNGVGAGIPKGGLPAAEGDSDSSSSRRRALQQQGSGTTSAGATSSHPELCECRARLCGFAGQSPPASGKKHALA